MKRNNTDSDEIKKKMGDRLTEVMNLFEIGPSEMERRLQGYKKQTINKYQKAVNWMPSDFIEAAADLLGIYSGYLSGDDNFSCSSYAEYENMKVLLSMKDSKKYFHLFKDSGLSLSADNGVVIIDDSFPLDVGEPLYHLTKRSGSEVISKDFTEDEMESYYQSVMKYLHDYFDQFNNMRSVKEGDADDLK